MSQLTAITWLGEPVCHDPWLSGGKAAALSRLAERFRIPPGFCITSHALSGIAPPIGLPNRLRAAVVEAYRALQAGDPAVAVRSSAVDEDGAATSFAGVHETFLNIRGNEAVLLAVEGCLESFFGERALSYRREHGIDATPRAAVLVQQQIVSDVSVVAFSANPVTSNLDEIVVTASWGLGESIVGGTVTPDTWTLCRDGAILDERIGDKRRMTVAVDGGSREVDVPRVMRAAVSLRAEQLTEVAGLATALEQQTGVPVDIECAYAGDRLYLLQCRPITTLNLARRRDPPTSGPAH